MSTGKPHFLRTPYGKLTLALGFMVLSWIYLLLHFSSDFGNLLPSEEAVKKIRSEVAKEKKEFENLDSKKRAADAVKKQYQAKLENCWREEVDGDVILGLRQLIENAAKNKDLKLDSLGSTRTSKISNGLCFAELDISMTADLKQITALLTAVEECKPAVYWKRVDIRPGIMRQRQQQTQTTQTVNAARRTNAPEVQQDTASALRLWGTVRVICVQKNGEGKGQ
ncbi:MAG: hypothetical protein IKB16_03815 [Lentisphaeria bacterium]|nr:hypothetical protein [Lentisphaeria bacterium]